jgi:hypothetical protein
MDEAGPRAPAWGGGKRGSGAVIFVGVATPQKRRRGEDRKANHQQTSKDVCFHC